MLIGRLVASNTVTLSVVPVRIEASSGSFSGTFSRQPMLVQVWTVNFSSGLASTLS